MVPAIKEGIVLGRKTRGAWPESSGLEGRGDWRDGGEGDCDRARVAVLPRKCGTFQGLENQKEKQRTLSDQVLRPQLSLVRDGSWRGARCHRLTSHA